MIPQLRDYRTMPPIRSGYALDDAFFVVVPIARANEVANPSGETNTTGYTAGAGTLTRSTEQQYHGAYSFKYVPSAATTDGFYYALTTTVAFRAISCKFLGVAGVPYVLSIATTAPADLVSYAFVGTGRWQWVWLYLNEASATTRRIYFKKGGSASTGAFYVDGVQSEVLASAAETVSTYIDGDQPGLVPNQFPPAYLWAGVPHASTSQRSGLTRAGGQVIRFRDLGFLLTAIIGLGLATPQNVATDYARIDGAYDDYTRKPARQFTLTGRFEGLDYAQLRDNRSSLARLFDRDNVAQDQQLVLLHRLEDGCGAVALSNDSRILCKYAGGFGGSTNNHYAEDVAISFTNYLPTVRADGEQGTALTVQQNISDVNMIIQRSAGGQWRALGTGGLGGGVFALLYGPDGAIYAAGDFTSMGGVASTARIAKWNGSAWSALGTGLNGTGLAIAVGPDGAIYVGGNFLLAGGVANTAYVAKWNGSAWSALGTGMNNRVTGLAFDASGNLYATGFFTTAGGGAANRIAKWNGSAWSALGTGLNGDGYSITRGPDGFMYVGGDFTTANGTSAARIARFTGTTFTALSTGLNGIAKKIAFAPSGILYVVGLFTTAGGVTTRFAASWNGSVWSGLGSGIAGGTTTETIAATPTNGFLVGGDFTAVNGVALSDGVAQWNGATWLPLDVDLPGASTIVYAAAASPTGEITLGYDSGGTAAATAAGITSATNGGTDRTYPILTIQGPSSGTSRISQIVNATTGRAVYLNLTINAGETVRMSFTPDNLSFVSTFQGNIASTILPGSTEADFFLQPGANAISFFASAATVTATLEWWPCYASLDDVP